MKIGIIGAGSFGTSLAILVNENGHDVIIYGNNKSQVEVMNSTRKNENYLKNILIPESIKISNNIEEVRDCQLILFSVPSKAIRTISNELKNILKEGTIIVNVAKGIEEGSLLRLSQVISEVLPNCKVSVLSGPSHAEEVAQKLATTCVVSSEDLKVSEIVRDVFMNKNFRVYINNDIIGVELGGALKNLIALASGISDGIGFGDNTKAALMTRGMVEITRLGVAMGAKAETFSGLTGVGDLIVTCTSMHSRNRRAGILLGKGYTLKETLEEIKMVVEGVNTAEAAYDLSVKYNVKMPITNEIYQVIFNNKNTKDAVIELMTREKTTEYEDVSVIK